MTIGCTTTNFLQTELQCTNKQTHTRHTFKGMKAPEESNVPISPSSSSVHHSGRSLSSSSPSLPARRRPPPWPSESRKSKSNFLRRLSPGTPWSRQPAERGPPSNREKPSAVSEDTMRSNERKKWPGYCSCPDSPMVKSYNLLYLKMSLIMLEKGP